MKASCLTPLLAAAALLTISFAGPAIAQHRVNETDLVSDIPGRAQRTDANLVNPWGIVPGPTGVFWVSDNHSGVSTLYQPDGTILSLVVTIPGGAPTGVVVTSAQDSAFVIPSGDTTVRAVFIFASEAGVLTAWNPANTTNAAQVASTSEAIYKGLAVAHSGTGPRLYAADFHHGRIDVFNRSFLPIMLPGTFTEPTLPPGYAPFNVAAIGGKLYVAYAKQDAAQEDDDPGPGFGFISVFDLNGNFLSRFASAGDLNAPWGMVAAPAGWGGFSHALLVGNFGDGSIHAFDSGNGTPLGAVQDSLGATLTLPGLWGLSFGAAASGTAVAHRLYFAAGIQNEDHGLFGYLAPRQAVVACDGSKARSASFWAKQCGPLPGSHGRAWGRFKEAMSADSLQALFACASSSPVFGSSGCFTASCELLQKHGHLAVRERVARQYLALLLNRCSGRTCDDVILSCGDGDDGDGDGGDGHDDGGHHGGDGHDAVTGTSITVGDLIAQLDAALCGNSTDRELSRLGELAACANSLDGEGDDDDMFRGGGVLSPMTPGIGLLVRPLGNPIRFGGPGMQFAINTMHSMPVRLGIYDAAGRRVVELLRDATVTGAQVVRWDGRDQRGAPVVPGTYFYRAIAGELATSGRIVVIR